MDIYYNVLLHLDYTFFPFLHHTEEVFLESFPDQVVTAKVIVSELLGAETQLYCKVGNTDLVSKVDARDFTKPGAKVRMGFEMNKSHFFDPETQKAVEN